MAVNENQITVTAHDDTIQSIIDRADSACVVAEFILENAHKLKGIFDDEAERRLDDALSDYLKTKKPRLQSVTRFVKKTIARLDVALPKKTSELSAIVGNAVLLTYAAEEHIRKMSVVMQMREVKMRSLLKENAELRKDKEAYEEEIVKMDEENLKLMESLEVMDLLSRGQAVKW